MARTKKPTQRDRVLRFIKDYGSITRAEGFTELGIVELPARICELEKEGYQFSRKQESAVNRYGERVYYTRYSLVGEVR